jgi:hypothetical protein
MKNPFDLSTIEITRAELNAIHEALVFQEIDITPHAERAANDENIPLVAMLEAVLVGRPVSKDLPANDKNRVPGINFEYEMKDRRWIRVKVAWVDGYFIITVHTI